MGTRVMHRNQKFWRIAAFFILVTSLCAWIAASPQRVVRAQAPSLSVFPITWNIIGLNATNPSLGPAEYLAGVQVCSDDAPAPNVNVMFVWDSTNPYINLASPALQSIGTIPAGGCRDVYFGATVTRNLAAINTFRQFSVIATSGSSSAANAYPLQLDVRGFIPTGILETDDLDGPATVTVGSQVQYELSLTASQEFGSLVYALSFPQNLLSLRSVEAAYPGQPPLVNASTWEDACSWQLDPTQPDYNTCGGDTVITGTAVVTYTFEVMAEGSGTLFPVLYGYAGITGTTYLYADDYGQDFLNFVAQEPGTPTATRTNQPTGTQEETSTVTPTGSLTPTVTQTGNTPTRTPTGSTPTATATGSITPNPGGTKSVSPTQAGIGQELTFKIRVTNNGTAPAQNVVVTDSFANYAYLDVRDVSTEKGSFNINGRVVTVTIPIVMPKEEIDITIKVRVNNTAVGTLTPSNSASISYTGGSRTTNSISFKVLGGSTLPGTGQDLFPAPAPDMRVPLVIAAVVLSLGGLAAFRLALWAWKHHRAALRIYLVTGAVLAAAAVFAGACSLNEPAPTGSLDVEMGVDPDGVAEISVTATSTINPLAIMPAYMFATPGALATLPAYPVPSPVVGTATPLPGGSDELDTTNIERIVIPALDVDNEVAYVPFDGHTWMINGLRQEVAWMGDTSWPGLGGNTGLAAHVTVAGEGNGPFRYLYDLQPGDTIDLYTGKNIYTYEVNYKVALEETDLSVLEQSEAPRITLLTCVDWDENLRIYLRRYAVVADLVSVMPVTIGSGR